MIIFREEINEKFKYGLKFKTCFVARKQPPSTTWIWNVEIEVATPLNNRTYQIISLWSLKDYL